jgi:hypothetical protein
MYDLAHAVSRGKPRSILIMGGKHFWRFNMGCCLLITIIPYLYCFLVIPDLDGKRLAWPGVQGGTGVNAMAPYIRGKSG